MDGSLRSQATVTGGTLAAARMRLAFSYLLWRSRLAVTDVAFEDVAVVIASMATAALAAVAATAPAAANQLLTVRQWRPQQTPRR